MAQLIKNSLAMRETWVCSLGLEDSPGEGNSYQLQYSGLENSMDCTAHGTAESNMTERFSLFTMNLKILILVFAFSIFGKCIIPRDLF